MANDDKIRIYYSEDMLRHGRGRKHPECPERLENIMRTLNASPMRKMLDIVEPSPATAEDVRTVHAPAYVDLIKNADGALDGDTYCGDGTYFAALKATGAGIAAVDEALDGRKFSFSLIRPPGHHAYPESGGGFCIFNNAAIAAEHAVRKGLKRVMIVDFDYHHGNGTEAIFYARGDVFYFSTHGPGYPGTGSATDTGVGAGEGCNMNVPLPCDAGDREFGMVYSTLLFPKVLLYKPELIIVSAGFDPHYDDPIGAFKVTENGFRDISGIISRAARAVDCPVVALLEGGYSLDHIGPCVEASIMGFLPDVRAPLNRPL